MVAVYDYDPLKQSPSKDKSKELNLRKGQYVTVVGDMVCLFKEFCHSGDWRPHPWDLANLGFHDI